MRLNKKRLLSIIVGIILMSSMLVNFAGIFINGEEDKPEIAVLETSMGVIEIDLFWDESPVTASNFARYVEEGFYNDTVIHQVVQGFIIQGGGFTANGTRKPTHDPIPLESQNGLRNERGTIAMARTSETQGATSQFFINLGDNDFLNYREGFDGYAVFGRVVSGMEVADAISGVETEVRGPYEYWPSQDIVIEGAYLKDG